MSGKAGLYVVVDTLRCQAAYRAAGWPPCENLRASVEFLGMVVEVTGNANHGPCCAAVSAVIEGPTERCTAKGDEGWSVRWENLKPLEDPGDVGENLLDEPLTEEVT